MRQVAVAGVVTVLLVGACAEGPKVDTEQATGASDVTSTEQGGQASPDGTGRPEVSDTEADPVSTTVTTKAQAPTSEAEDEEDDVDDELEREPDDESDDDADEAEDDGDDDSSGGANDPDLSGLDRQAQQSFAYVNERRAEQGLDPLAVDLDLATMAKDWAHQMIDEQELYHNPALGDQRPSRFGTIGENIALSSNPADIDGMWWNSDGHRANIVGSGYTHVGIAFVADSGGTTWAVQVFAG